MASNSWTRGSGGTRKVVSAVPAPRRDKTYRHVIFEQWGLRPSTEEKRELVARGLRPEHVTTAERCMCRIAAPSLSSVQA